MGRETYGGACAWRTLQMHGGDYFFMTVSSITPMTGFDRFELPEPLLRGIRAVGFQNPRPIQIETNPAGLEGRDVLGLAQTGTGKTAAFALPLLHRLLKANGNRASFALTGSRHSYWTKQTTCLTWAFFQIFAEYSPRCLRNAKTFFSRPRCQMKFAGWPTIF